MDVLLGRTLGCVQSVFHTTFLFSLGGGDDQGGVGDEERPELLSRSSHTSPLRGVTSCYFIQCPSSQEILGTDDPFT